MDNRIYQEDARDIYNRLGDLKSHVDELKKRDVFKDKEILRCSHSSKEQLHKVIFELERDNKKEIEDLRKTLDSSLRLLKEMGEAHRAEFVVLSTKLMIFFGIVGVILSVLLEVGSSFALEKFFS